MADAGTHWFPTVLRDHFGDGVGGDQVVDDGRAGLLAQVALGDECADRGRSDRVALFVDHEAPIGVAVEGQSDVGLLINHEFLEVHKVLRLQGVGHVVRECSVELEIQRSNIQRKATQNGGDGVPTHSVAGIHRDNEGTRGSQVDEAIEELRVAGQHIFVRGLATVTVISRNALHEVIFDLSQTGLLPHRPSSRAAHLDAVVLGRVVRGGEHCSRPLHAPGCVVQLIGRAQMDLDDVEPLIHNSLGESVGQRW